MALGVIDLVNTHEGGSSESVRHELIGRQGLTHLSTYEKSPLLHVFCNIFICKVF